uniref:SAM-dependent methyltransferase n=1 Tax=Streptomyces griseomycini TaxID=66895 RepID=UPI003570AEB3
MVITTEKGQLPVGTREITAEKRNTGTDAPVPIDTGEPHPARRYDWFPGGKDDHPVDEEPGRRFVALAPVIPVMARWTCAAGTGSPASSRAWSGSPPASWPPRSGIRSSASRSPARRGRTAAPTWR